MGWSEHYRSKIPLKLVFIGLAAVLINAVLIFGFQLVGPYRFTGPIDSEVLGQMDRSYEGCTILDRAASPAEDDDLTVYLVETQDGTEQVVTVQKHYLFDRYRLVKSACKELDPDAQSIRLRAGTGYFTLGVSHNQVSGHSDIRWESGFGPGSYSSFKNSMFLGIVALCVVEFLVYCLVFKREEIT